MTVLEGRVQGTQDWCQSCTRRHIGPYVMAADKYFYCEKKGHQYWVCCARLGNKPPRKEQQKVQGMVYAMTESKNVTKEENPLVVVKGTILVARNYAYILF